MISIPWSFLFQSNAECDVGDRAKIGSDGYHRHQSIPLLFLGIVPRDPSGIAPSTIPHARTMFLLWPTSLHRSALHCSPSPQSRLSVAYPYHFNLVILTAFASKSCLQRNSNFSSCFSWVQVTRAADTFLASVSVKMRVCPMRISLSSWRVTFSCTIFT